MLFVFAVLFFWLSTGCGAVPDKEEKMLCQWCLCLALAMQSGGNCHKCTEGTQEQLVIQVRNLREPSEFLAASCYPKGDKPEADFSKQGPIVPFPKQK